MEVKLADNYGFCFGVKRAIEIAEKYKNSATMGPLIHNSDEINRLKDNFNVKLYRDINEVEEGDTLIIRTHGIPKNDLKSVKKKTAKVINATCPFVTTPQQIVKKMSAEDYEILIFGDKTHPEVMGVRSYAKNPENVHVVLNLEEAKALNLTNTKIATVAQTTKKKEMYLEIVNYLTLINKEVRIFNTICDATFENQDAARKLSKEVDVMVIIGGKSSSNTKQLQTIALENCKDAYLIENKNDLQDSWFKDKKLCGITAGASTPDWIIKEIVEQIKSV